MFSARQDVVVVGAGFSGLSAALVLARARRQVLVVDAQRPRNRFASHIHGYLGAEGVSPAAFRANAIESLLSYGARFIENEAVELDRDDTNLIVRTEQAGLDP
ncbi:FAD-dependent oxidoreductase [Microbacterium lacticum]